jgi:formylglycine-generating enzyme required for sulfatase activity
MRLVAAFACAVMLICVGLSSSHADSATPLTPEREGTLKPGDIFKECDNCPEMVVVPSGSFMMGSPVWQTYHRGNESPRHSVTISKPFAVGRFAVTFDEWDACVADGGCKWKPADRWGRGRQPVIHVSWDDAKAYATWLSGKTGKTYRLLSEAEREYVARAGTTTPYWWGASISTSQANYNSSKTVPVDSFQPNPWGLYQVHGNVWEWVEDCYNDTYIGALSDGSAWVVVLVGQKKAIAIAVRNISGRRRWSKLGEWLCPDPERLRAVR